MKKLIFFSSLILCSVLSFAESTSLQKDKTTSDCPQLVHFTNPGNTYAGGLVTVPTLDQVVAAGSNTTKVVSLNGKQNTVGQVVGSGTEEWDATFGLGAVNVGYNARKRINKGYGSLIGGYNQGTQEVAVLNTAGWNWGYINSSSAWSYMSGVTSKGAVNWPYLPNANDFLYTVANGGWNVGQNNTNIHDMAYMFGSGMTSQDTNAHHAVQYFVQSRVMPFASNTVDVGSQTLPFRSVSASNFNVVGSSITFNGTLAFTVTNGNTLVAHLPLQNPDGSSIGGSTTRSTITSTTNYTVIVAESSKMLVMDSSSDRIFNLPSVGASDVGTYYTFVKVGSGRLTIDAADSDTIADSGVGDTIYDSQAAETYATVTLILAIETKWVISGAHGTWTTTD